MAEKLVKPVTDTLLVMNRADYTIARKHCLCGEDSLYRIDGMGFDSSRFLPCNREEKNRLRADFGYSESEFLLVYAAEFSSRKNQRFLIDAIKRLHENGCPLIRLLLLGNGKWLGREKNYAEQAGCSSYIRFAGYQDDTRSYYRISDVCVSSSRSEGLPFNIMEAMAAGLPVVASRVKGHVDLIQEGENGWLYELGKEDEFCSRIWELYKDRSACSRMGSVSQRLAAKYDIKKVLPQVVSILESEYQKKNP